MLLTVQENSQQARGIDSPPQARLDGAAEEVAQWRGKNLATNDVDFAHARLLRGKRRVMRAGRLSPTIELPTARAVAHSTLSMAVYRAVARTGAIARPTLAVASESGPLWRAARFRVRRPHVSLLVKLLLQR